MTVYAEIEGFRFSGSRLQTPNHDELLLAENLGRLKLLADDGDALYSFPLGTTEREILFYLAGEAAAHGSSLCHPAEGDIYNKLVALIRLGTQHGIRIDRLMHKALDFCDPEPPFCN
jgi:hypothetical protein